MTHEATCVTPVRRYRLLVDDGVLNVGYHVTGCADAGGVILGVVIAYWLRQMR